MASNSPQPSPSAGSSSARAAPLDRKAVERVLARAAELQGPSDVASESTGEAISETQLFEIAREVGLAPAAMNQALAEERTRINVPEEPGWLGRLTGPGLLSATRVVRGNPRDVLAMLDDWMQRGECLQVQRRFSDRVVWEARQDWVGGLRRALNIGGHGYQLARTRQVSATVVPVDDGRVLVRLDADLSPTRRQKLRYGGATTVAGVAAGNTFLGIGWVAHAALLAVGPFALACYGAGAYAGYRIAHGYRGTAERTQLALEQILDRLEHGENRKAGSLLDVLATRPLLR